MKRAGVVLLFSVLAVTQGGVIHDGTRIVNGQDVALGEIPYQVSIQYIDESHHFCGGSVLNSNYVLTAAHCVHRTDPNTIRVVAGTVHLDQPQAIHKVIDIRVHQNYNRSDSWINDLALIKVEPPFKFSKTISAVKLPKANAQNSAGETAVVSGWGRLWGRLYQNIDPDPNTLQKVELKIADQEYCREVYDGDNLENIDVEVHDTQICAHDPLVSDGICQGDSGGPLTVDGILVGIPSWTRGCGLVNYPGVFTRVSNYVDWIQKYSV